MSKNKKSNGRYSKVDISSATNNSRDWKLFNAPTSPPSFLAIEPHSSGHNLASITHTPNTMSGTSWSLTRL